MTRLDLTEMPGLVASDQRGAVDWKNGGGTGWKRFFSPDRLLLIALVLFDGGRFWQGQQNTNEVLARQIEAVIVRLDIAENTFARKDVLHEQLDSISRQLDDLKTQIAKSR